MTNILDNLIMSIEEAAELWGVSTRTVRNWCDDELIVAKKLSREWAIMREQPKPKLKPGRQKNKF